MIELRDYQQEAIKKAIAVKKVLLCLITGSGKTIISIFYSRLLFKKKLIDKVIVSCTVTSTSVIQKEFKNKVNIDTVYVEDLDQFISFLNSKSEKIAVIKHTLFEKVGLDKIAIDKIKKQLKNNPKKIALIIDEAHKFCNMKSLIHRGYNMMRSFFDRVVLLTATPYTSCISQIFGLVNLINLEAWRSKEEFANLYIDEFKLIDRNTGRVKFKQVQRYKNLKHLRSVLENFTYFFFPPIKLRYIEHVIELQSYEEYDNLCSGLVGLEDVLE